MNSKFAKCTVHRNPVVLKADISAPYLLISYCAPFFCFTQGIGACLSSNQFAHIKILGIEVNPGNLFTSVLGKSALSTTQWYIKQTSMVKFKK